jgi:hypothetical protein
MRARMLMLLLGSDCQADLWLPVSEALARMGQHVLIGRSGFGGIPLEMPPQ